MNPRPSSRGRARAGSWGIKINGACRLRPKISEALPGSCRGRSVSAVSVAAAAPQGLTRPRAILFDWDNTLVDSWTTIHEALNAVMAAMEKPLWSLRET